MSAIEITRRGGSTSLLDWLRGGLNRWLSRRVAGLAASQGLLAGERVDGLASACATDAPGAIDARALFARGRPLCDRVGRDLRFEMRLTWLGGSGILDAIEAVGFDVFRRRPSYGLVDKARLAWRAACFIGSHARRVVDSHRCRPHGLYPTPSAFRYFER